MLLMCLRHYEAETRNISTLGELSYIFECQATELFVVLKFFIMSYIIKEICSLRDLYNLNNL